MNDARLISADTKQAAKVAVAARDSLRSAAKVLRIHHAVLADVLNDRHAHVSRQAENRVRLALGLAPLPVPVPVDPCPDCGSVHVGRCHGKDGETVVLASTDKVVKVRTAPKRKRRRYHRPVATEVQEARRMALDVGWQDIIEAGLNALESDK